MLNLIIGFNDFNDWHNQLYTGGSTDDWCHSALPLFTSEYLSPDRSEVCCPVYNVGTFGYYAVDENVKIFGYK